jgi:hypothetical protein
MTKKDKIKKTKLEITPLLSAAGGGFLHFKFRGMAKEISFIVYDDEKFWLDKKIKIELNEDENTRWIVDIDKKIAINKTL